MIAYSIGRGAWLSVVLVLQGCADGSVQGVDLENIPLLSVVEGSFQTDTVLATLPVPLRVRASLGEDPRPGVTIRWGHTDATTVTDDRGEASMVWMLGELAGVYTTWAWIPDAEGAAARQVEFTATARPGAPVALRVPRLVLPIDEIEEIREQVGPPGSPLLINYTAGVEDAYRNLTGDPVEWVVTSGGGSLEEVPALLQQYLLEQPLTGASDVRHTLGTATGANVVVARAPDELSLPDLTFTATAVDVAVQLGEEGRFFPDSVAVTVGQIVGWIWATDWIEEVESSAYNSIDWYGGPGEHDLVFEDDPDPPTSSLVRQVGGHARMFTQPGTYRYRCTLHSETFASGEVGMVTVSASAP